MLEIKTIWLPARMGISVGMFVYLGIAGPSPSPTVAYNSMPLEQFLAGPDEPGVQDLDIIVHEIDDLVLLPHTAVQELLITAPIIADIRPGQDISFPQAFENIIWNLFSGSVGNNENISFLDFQDLLEELFPEMPTNNTKSSSRGHRYLCL